MSTLTSRSLIFQTIGIGGLLLQACAPSAVGTTAAKTTTSAVTTVAAAGAATNLYLTGATSIATTDCSPYVITVKDASQNTVVLAAAVTANLITSGTGTYYSDSACTLPITTTSLAIGQNSKILYYRNPSAQSVVLLANSATLFPGNAVSLLIVTSTQKIAFSGVSTYLAQSGCSAGVTVSTLDGSNNPLAVAGATVINLAGSATTSFYASAGCGTASVTSVTVLTAQSTATVYIKDTAAESIAVTGSVAGWTQGTLPLTIYPSLAIIPSSRTLGVSVASTSFAGSGGAAPFSYSIVNGTLSNCAVNSSTGLFTAPASTGTCSVRVTDAAGQQATSAVTVVSTLAIVPTAVTLQISHNKTFTATGGSGTYAYSITSAGQAGESLVNSSNTGIYTAPSVTGTSTLRVSDGTGATATAQVTTLPQPLVELLFDENAFNWTVNGGNSNATHTKAGFNGRSNLIYSSAHPAGNSSVASVDFGNGGQDVAIDLLQPGGLRGDFYVSQAFGALGTPTGSKMDSSINYNTCSTNVFPAINPGNSPMFIRYLGRILPDLTGSYTVRGSTTGFCNNYSFGLKLASPQGLASQTTPNAACSFETATAALAGISLASSVFSDIKAEISEANNCNTGSYDISWQSPPAGPAPVLTAITAAYLYAPTPVGPLASLSSFTLTGWLNNRSAAQDGTIVATWLNPAGGGAELRYRSDGSLQLGVNESALTVGTPRSSSGRVTSDGSTLAANWVFYAVTYDSVAQTAHYYFGSAGNPASSDMPAISYNKGATSATVSELTLGNFTTRSLASREAATSAYRGLMDDFRIFPGVLTLPQIQAVQAY